MAREAVPTCTPIPSSPITCRWSERMPAAWRSLPTVCASVPASSRSRPTSRTTRSPCATCRNQVTPDELNALADEVGAMFSQRVTACERRETLDACEACALRLGHLDPAAAARVPRRRDARPGVAVAAAAARGQRRGGAPAHQQAVGRAADARRAGGAFGRPLDGGADRSPASRCSSPARSPSGCTHRTLLVARPAARVGARPAAGTPRAARSLRSAASSSTSTCS